MFRYLAPACALLLAGSAIAQTPPAGDTLSAKDAELVTIGPDGLPSYKLGYGGRKWKGVDPRKAAEKKAAALAAAAKQETLPPPAKKESPPKMRGDRALKSDASIAREKREAEAKAQKEAAKAAAAASAPPPLIPPVASPGNAQPPSMSPTTLPQI